MFEFFNNPKFNYISIFILLATSIFTCIQFIPNTRQQSYTQLLCMILLLLISNIVYDILVIKKNCLPWVNKNKLAILFIVNTEKHEIYNTVKYKLIDEFNEKLKSSKKNFKILCIPKSLIHNYNLDNNESVIKLLIRTNCIFIINVKYNVDDVNNFENYELELKIGIIHPKFTDIAEKILLQNMDIIHAPIHKQKGNKENLIQKFNFTANYLTLTCKYIIGFVLLLGNVIEDSNILLSEVYSILALETHNTPVINVLKYHIKSPLFQSYLLLAGKENDKYYLKKDKKHLIICEDLLEKANIVIPNTYEYNLYKSPITFLLYRDIKSAINYINNCKSIKKHGEWLYSEAFLLAYSNKNPWIIYKKYKYAFKDDCYIVSITDFIEEILIEEPEKIILHFALGLIYEESKHFILMKKHFSLFKDKSYLLDSTLLQMINEKILSNSCSDSCSEIECDNMCSVCSITL